MARNLPIAPTPQSRLFVRKPSKQVTFYPLHTKPTATDQSLVNEAAEQIFEQIKIYLSQHVKDRICLNELCKRFKYNKFTLLRQFKQYTGFSPINYLITLRIETAKKLMHSTELPLVQIALESGFYDQSHFSNCFVKFVGLTPREYRKSCSEYILQQ